MITWDESPRGVGGGANFGQQHIDEDHGWTMDNGRWCLTLRGWADDDPKARAEIERIYGLARASTSHNLLACLATAIKYGVHRLSASPIAPPTN